MVQVLILLLLLWPRECISADDSLLSAGSLTSELPLDLVLELPGPGVPGTGLFDQHVQGHSLFHSSFRGVRKNGKQILGPHFSNDSCGSCHMRTGRGSLVVGRNDSLSSMVVKISLLRGKSKSSSAPVPGLGEQLQEHSLSGGRRYNTKLAWRYIEGAYPDGTPFTLRRPKLSFTIPLHPKSRIGHSLRMSPALVGMGLLEAIPIQRLEDLADIEDRNGDGISGRIHYVKDETTGSSVVGRFGFRATSPTLEAQTATALLLDMGITSDFLPQKTRSPEISTLELHALTTYLRISGVPRFRNVSDPRFASGLRIFEAARCGDCHVVTHKTSSAAIPEILASQTIHPFTNLLLHDMGRGLADTRRERFASSREWRTAPLWGLGLAEITATPPFGYLHDGRARTLEEAILWHGGEAGTSRDLFMRLAREARSDLLFFLGSL